MSGRRHPGDRPRRPGWVGTGRGRAAAPHRDTGWRSSGGRSGGIGRRSAAEWAPKRPWACFGRTGIAGQAFVGPPFWSCEASCPMLTMLPPDSVEGLGKGGPRAAGGTGSPSSSGLGPRPFKAVARVRIPLGARSTVGSAVQQDAVQQGPVAQLVSASPCHGEGRGFESRLGRKAVRLQGRAAAWPGSSVGTSDRLKSGRSAVRPRPWPRSQEKAPADYPPGLFHFPGGEPPARQRNRTNASAWSSCTFERRHFVRSGSPDSATRIASSTASGPFFDVISATSRQSVKRP